MADRSTTPHNSGYTIAARVDGSGSNGSRINLWVEYYIGTPNYSNNTVPLTAHFYADLKDGKTSSTSSTAGTSSSFTVNGIAGSGHSGGCDFRTVGKPNHWGSWSGNISFSSNTTLYVPFSGTAKTHSSYISGGSISGTIAVSYYKEFTITYNPGSRGCSGSVVTDKQAWGAGYTHRGAGIFTPPTGYYISGWSLNSDDNTAEYGLGQTHAAGYAFGDSVTLYPTIAANSYSYNFNVLLPDGSEPWQTGEAGTVECSINSGSWTRICNEAASSYPYGTTFKFRNFSPGTGMVLSSVSGATQNSDGTWSATMGTSGLNINFYTTWCTYSIAYSANGGSSTPSTQTKTYNVALTLAGAITRAAASKTVSTTFNANGGTFNNKSSWTITTTATSPYSFTGWKATNGTIYSAGDTYTANEGTTMTAQWSGGSTYTGGAVSMYTPSRTGYSFEGWFTEAEGGARFVGEQLYPTTNSTIYAHWAPLKYVVNVYDPNTNKTLLSTTVSYGQSITLPELPSAPFWQHISQPNDIEFSTADLTSLVEYRPLNVYQKEYPIAYYNDTYGSFIEGVSYTQEQACDVDILVRYEVGDSLKIVFTAPNWAGNRAHMVYWQKANGSHSALPSVITPGSVVELVLPDYQNVMDGCHGTYIDTERHGSLAQVWYKNNGKYEVVRPLYKSQSVLNSADIMLIKYNGQWISIEEYLRITNSGAVSDNTLDGGTLDTLILG